MTHDKQFEEEVTQAIARSEKFGKALKVIAGILAAVFAAGVAFATYRSSLASASDLAAHEKQNAREHDEIREEVGGYARDVAEVKGYVKHIADDVHWLRAKDDRKHEK